MSTTQVEARLRRGVVVRYHGTHEQFHGLWFKVAEVLVLNGRRRYHLAHWDDPDRRTVLWAANARSLTHIPARNIVTRKCRECGLEHTYERSELLAGVSCALAIPQESPAS